MAGFFSSAATQMLINSAPAVVDVPFTVGMWVYPTTTGTLRSFWSLGDTAGAANFWRISQDSSNVWQFVAQPNIASGGTVTANQLAFLVARGISSANRRMAVLQGDGSIAHMQNTTGISVTGVDTMTLGATNVSVQVHLFDGGIGEFWYTNTDIQPDGAQLDENLLRELAYGGPFSVPSVAKDVVEYRSLRKYPSADGNELGEVYSGAFGPQTWTNTNGVTIGPHPPLPYWYVKPNQVKTELVI
jgi:hypothetical protein